LVIEAENGDEGIRCYQAEPADLVITDIQMPVMDGLQMIKELRGAFPMAKVIVICGEKGRLTAAQTLSQHILEKPIYMEEFLDAVHKLVAAPGSSISMVQHKAIAAGQSVQGDA
jgi:two-component system response regulator YesN